MKIVALFFRLILISVFLLGCKTGAKEASSTLAKVGEHPLACAKKFSLAQTRQRAASVSMEEYSYENRHLIKRERFFPNGKTSFVDRMVWKDNRLVGETRSVDGSDIFAVEYTYKNGLIDKKKVDDSDESGHLRPDGIFDFEEVYFYEKGQKGFLLSKKTITRPNLESMEVSFSYNTDGQESERWTRRGEVVIEHKTNTYKKSKLSHVEFNLFGNQKIITYDYLYNEAGQILSIQRKGADGEDATWTYLYDCQKQ